MTFLFWGEKKKEQNIKHEFDQVTKQNHKKEILFFVIGRSKNFVSLPSYGLCHVLVNIIYEYIYKKI